MNELKLLFAGDFCAQGRNEPLVARQDIDGIFGGLLNEINRSDLTVVDLEAPLVSGGQQRPKTGPHLLAPPASASVLAKAGVGLLVMANNHIMDYEEEGLSQTLEVCHRAGLSTTGVGKSLAEARKPFSRELGGRKVAIINVTENEWSNAEPGRAGANPADPVMNYQDIKLAAASHDVVIIVYHGGNEHYALPSPRLKALFRFYVDAGATAVIAHHTHVVSGYEVYHGAPIFYGLGNLLFDWPGKRNDPWNIGLAVRLVIGQTVRFDLVPFRQSDETPGIQLLEDPEKMNMLNRIEELNHVIQDDAKLADAFNRYCTERDFVYTYYLEPYRNRVLSFLRRRGMLPGFLSPARKRLYLNIIRCEAHRDVLLHALKK